MRKACLPFAALLVAPAIAASAQDITGDVRTSFVKSSTQSCVKAASTPAALKVLTPEIIQNACSCYSERAADIITGAELRAMIKNGAVSPEVGAKLKPLMASCLKQVIK